MSYNPHVNSINQHPTSCCPESVDFYTDNYSENDAMDTTGKLYPLPGQNIANIQHKNNQQQIHQAYRQPIKHPKMYQCEVNNSAPRQYFYGRSPCAPTQGTIPCPNYYPQYYESHQYCPLSTMSQQDTSFDTMGYGGNVPNTVAHHYSYRNIPNAEHNQRQYVKQSAKRYPVTAPTPKYYRKPASTSVYKRPSALCLPVASQPDPAVYRRSRKQPPSDSPFEIQQVMLRTINTPSTTMLKNHSSTMETLHQITSEGDATFKLPNLDDMFDHLETDNPECAQHQKEILKMSKFLKPKLPPSLVVKNKNQPEDSNPTIDNSDSVCITEENPPFHKASADKHGDSLDKLLQQLKKCEMNSSSNEAIKDSKVQSQRASRETSKANSQQIARVADKTDDADNEQKSSRSMQNAKSFNYQDITEQIIRTQEELKGYTDSARESSTSIQEITKKISSSISSSSGRPRSVIPKPSLDDHCAIELHRSKSYIVNLIDRALSKELGTVPKEQSKKQLVSV